MKKWELQEVSFYSCRTINRLGYVQMIKQHILLELLSKKKHTEDDCILKSLLETD